MSQRIKPTLFAFSANLILWTISNLRLAFQLTYFQIRQPPNNFNFLMLKVLLQPIQSTWTFAIVAGWSQ